MTAEQVGLKYLSTSYYSKHTTMLTNEEKKENAAPPAGRKSDHPK